MHSICYLCQEDEGGERSQLRHPLEEGYRLKVSNLQSLSFLKDDDEGNFVPPRSSSPHKRILHHTFFLETQRVPEDKLTPAPSYQDDSEVSSSFGTLSVSRNVFLTIERSCKVPTLLVFPQEGCLGKVNNTHFPAHPSCEGQA